MLVSHVICCCESHVSTLHAAFLAGNSCDHWSSAAADASCCGAEADDRGSGEGGAGERGGGERGLSERGPDRMPEGARKQLAQGQTTAKADPEGKDGKDGQDQGVLGSLRV